MGLPCTTLAGMFADGLGRDADVGLAQKWYEKALEAFLVREESVKKKGETISAISYWENVCFWFGSRTKL